MTDMPHVHVVGATYEQIAREIVAMFKKEQPEEAAKWLADVKMRRQIVRDYGMMSNETGDLAPSMSIPSWVYYTYSRALGTNDWFPHDKVAIRALMNAIPEGRLIGGDGLCEGDRR